MTRINFANLGATAAAEQKRLSGYKAMLMVCTGTGCVSAKAFSLLDTLKEEISKRDLDKDFLVVGTGREEASPELGIVFDKAAIRKTD